MTHLPTGLVAESRSERSQHRNYRVALGLLKAKFYRLAEQRGQQLYDEKGDVSWKYQTRSYVLDPDQQVKDARTGTQTDRADAVLDGELDEFLRAYLAWRAQARAGG